MYCPNVPAEEMKMTPSLCTTSAARSMKRPTSGVAVACVVHNHGNLHQGTNE